LTLAGIALAGLAFTTDPTIRSTPATWHGRLHDLSFVLLGLSLMPAMILLGLAFRQDARWRDLSLYSWMTVALALPTFWLKGAAFYIFMLVVLVWSGAVARRLSSLAD
jgi:ABC-type dipeptide/oligopeptide/nickel transport system permease component